jgi:hypothetical protein
MRLLHNYSNSSEVFQNVSISGGVSYWLWEKGYDGPLKFITTKGGVEEICDRPLFEDGLDIILSDSMQIAILNKVRAHNFVSLNTITKGRNAFGIVGKQEFINSITHEKEFKGSVAVRCRDNKIRYTRASHITNNLEILNSWKVFISKSAGDPTNDKRVIRTPYLGAPRTACSDSLIPIGCFLTRLEAENTIKYLMTKFSRYMISIVKVSQNVSQNVYQFVPLQNFNTDSDIDWSLAITELDAQFYKKYNLTEDEIETIEMSIARLKEDH